MKYNLYKDGVLVHELATFNHAVGWCYRNQPFGVEPVHGTFAIMAGLRDHGEYTVGNHEAVVNRGFPCRWSGAQREANKIMQLAGHFE